MNLGTLTHRKGDLFAALSQNDSWTPIVVSHIVNNARQWGAGFVIPLGQFYPKAKEKYLSWSKTFGLRLGRTQIVNVSNSLVYVANMVAQDNTSVGPDFGRPLRYLALIECMKSVAKFSVGYQIWCPKFGSGIAGGDWNFIEELIKEIWIAKGINVTVFTL